MAKFVKLLLKCPKIALKIGSRYGEVMGWVQGHQEDDFQTISFFSKAPKPPNLKKISKILKQVKK